MIDIFLFFSPAMISPGIQEQNQLTIGLLKPKVDDLDMVHGLTSLV